MRKELKIFIFVICILVGLGLIKDVLIKSVITSVGSKILGAPLKIGSFSLSLFSQKVNIKNLRVYNPPGFTDDPLIDLPQIRVDYHLQSLISGKVYLPLVIVDLKEMIVVRNKDGKLNVDSLKVIEDQKAMRKKEGKSNDAQQDISLRIDLLKLNVEKVIFKDFSQGDPPRVEVFEVALKDKEFKDINSPQQLAILVMAQAMSQTAIKGAAIYGAATFLGMGFLPAGVVSVLAGKDDTSFEFFVKYDRVYKVALATVQEMGQLKSESKSTGIIKCKIKGADVAIKLADKDRSVFMTVSARQLLIPKPEIARGVLYQISEKLPH